MVFHSKPGAPRGAYIIYAVAAALFLLAGCSRNITVVRAQLEPPSPAAHSADTASPDSLRDALILFRQGQYDQARQSFEQAIVADSANWQAYYFLGLIARRQEHNDLALALLQRSLAFAPHDNRARARVYLAIAETYELKGQFGQAESNYRTALNLYPQSDTAREALDRLAARATASGQ